MFNYLRTIPVLDFFISEIIHYSLIKKICGWSYYLVFEHLVTKFYELIKLILFLYLLAFISGF
jgi:hypothetical protein